MKVIFSSLVAAIVSLPALSACQSNTPAANTPAENTTPTSSAPVVAQQPAETANPCSVHLWDGENFKDSDIVINGAGRYSNLRNLPNSNGKDWGDEADSLRVGSAATVTAYEEEDLKGRSVTFKPGMQQPELEEEPRSLEITCQ